MAVDLELSRPAPRNLQIGWRLVQEPTVGPRRTLATGQLRVLAGSRRPWLRVALPPGRHGLVLELLAGHGLTLAGSGRLALTTIVAYSETAPVFLGAGRAPSLAADTDGRPVVGWQSGNELAAWRYVDPSFQQSVTVRPASRESLSSPVVAAGGGRWLLVFQHSHPSYGSRLTAINVPTSGLPTTAVLAGSSARTHQAPRVAMAADGSAYALAWSEREPTATGPLARSVARAAVFSADGSRRGEIVELVTVPADVALATGLIALDDGNFAVAWSTQDRNTPARGFVQVLAADGGTRSLPLAIPEPLVALELVANERGFVVLHAPLGEDGPSQWVETHYDFAGTVSGGAPSFPYPGCAQVAGAARTASLRTDYLCSDVRVEGFPAEHAAIYVEWVGYQPPTALAVTDCGQAGGVGCAYPPPALTTAVPYPHRIDAPGGPLVNTRWLLAWAQADGIWLHRFIGGDYVRFSEQQRQVAKGETTRLEVARVGGGIGEVSVGWGTADGPARPGFDYVPAGGTLRWSDGDLSPRAIEVVTLDDGTDRTPSVGVALHSPTGNAILGAPARARIDLATAPTTCTAGRDTLCLGGGRFSVAAHFENPYNGTEAPGGALAYSDLTGFLWFDDARNPELAVKLLDFGTHLQFFYAQLTDFPFTLTVLDHHTGQLRTYRNTAGNCGGLDRDLLGSGPTLAPQAGTVCPADALCPLDGRYEVRVAWQNQYDGAQGAGMPAGLSDFAGLFSFADPRNVELVVKLLDFGDRVLLLTGSLSDLAYTVRIREVASGRERIYVNPPGRLCGVLDPAAF